MRPKKTVTKLRDDGQFIKEIDRPSNLLQERINDDRKIKTCGTNQCNDWPCFWNHSNGCKIHKGIERCYCHIANNVKAIKPHEIRGNYWKDVGCNQGTTGDFKEPVALWNALEIAGVKEETLKDYLNKRDHLWIEDPKGFWKSTTQRKEDRSTGKTSKLTQTSAFPKWLEGKFQAWKFKK